MTRWRPRAVLPPDISPFLGGAAYTSIANVTCADIGLIDGQNCSTIPGDGLDVGSPLTTPLGVPDPTYGGTTTIPGINNGLDDVPDIMYVNTVSPYTATDSQYSGRLDSNVIQRDLVTFVIYKVPVSSSSYNGPNLPATFWHHDQMNEAETLLWNHTFSPALINAVRANVAGWPRTEFHRRALVGSRVCGFDGRV